MDARIVEALLRLGLSDEKIAEFGELVDGIRRTVKEQGLITRAHSKAPTFRQAMAPKAGDAKTPAAQKRRKIVYRPTGKPAKPSDYARAADRTLQNIEKQQQRPAMPKAAAPVCGTCEKRRWEPGPNAPHLLRVRFEFSQRVRRLLGMSCDQAAAETMRIVEGNRTTKRR